MTQYILLRVDNDAEAQNLVDSLSDGDNLEAAAAFSSVDGPHPLRPKVVGQFKVPTQFCECDEERGIPHNRGVKYGWFVSPCCNKPKPWFGQTPINILPPETEAGNDPHFKDHVLSIYTDQRVGSVRRKKAIAAIEKSRTAE